MEKTHILIVDDDEILCKLIRLYLEAGGYSVATAHCGEDMVQQLSQKQPDLVILDLILPGTDGLTLAREYRKQSNNPIIILSSQKEVVDKVAALELGADDYVTKPFSERELLARIRSALRRSQGNPVKSAPATVNESQDSSTLQFDGFVLDETQHTLRAKNGSEVYLTAFEFQLLWSFASHPNRVLSREQLIDWLGGKDYTPYDRGIDVLVGKLRKKLNTDNSSQAMIETVRGVGYKFSALVQ